MYRWRHAPVSAVGWRAVALAALLAAVASCEGAGRDQIVAVSARGVVRGFVYFDANGTRAYEPLLDPGQPGVAVAVFPRGSRQVIARGTSGADGLYRLTNIPVGDYVAVVDSATVGDSARVVRVELDQFTLRPGDSVTTEVGVSFPAATVAQARGLVAGRRVFVTGVALTSPSSFGDSTVHLADATGAIRATAVLPGLVLIADNIRVLGTRAARDGQPTLDNVSIFPVGQPAAPVSEQVTTAVAATADAGRLDAALVRVVGLITDTTTVLPQGDYIATAISADSAGTVAIVFDGDAVLTISPYVPGVTVDATGVLVPTGSGTWRLKPRVTTDVVLR
jgi:hypothetical protein